MTSIMSEKQLKMLVSKAEKNKDHYANMLRIYVGDDDKCKQLRPHYIAACAEVARLSKKVEEATLM